MAKTMVNLVDSSMVQTRRPAPAAPAPAAAAPPKMVPVNDAATGAGIPLNFRVTAEFRRAFRTAAAQHDMRLSELLVASFDAWVEREKGR